MAKTREQQRNTRVALTDNICKELGALRVKQLQHDLKCKVLPLFSGIFVTSLFITSIASRNAFSPSADTASLEKNTENVSMVKTLSTNDVYSYSYYDANYSYENYSYSDNNYSYTDDYTYDDDSYSYSEDDSYSDDYYSYSDDYDYSYSEDDSYSDNGYSYSEDDSYSDDGYSYSEDDSYSDDYSYFYSEDDYDEDDYYFAENTSSIAYTEEEFFYFCQVLYSEAGASYISDEVVRAYAWVMRNRIAEENGNFYKGLNPNAFENVHKDENGYYYVTCPEGLVTYEMIANRPIIEEIATIILNALEESPVDDWICFQPYDCYGYSNPYSFAEDMGITEYKVFGNSIVFPERCWTETLSIALANL